MPHKTFINGHKALQDIQHSLKVACFFLFGRKEQVLSEPLRDFVGIIGFGGETTKHFEDVLLSLMVVGVENRMISKLQFQQKRGVCIKEIGDPEEIGRIRFYGPRFIRSNIASLQPYFLCQLLLTEPAGPS